MKVELIDTMGSDLSVVNAARVSFDKESKWEIVEGEWDDEIALSNRDIKLIDYLAKHNHWTPFGHIFASFRIKAPLFVARQLGKHQVGLVWNEVSRRYVDDEPEFYVPDGWRKRAENVKQGSSDELVGVEWYPNHLYEHQLGVYKRMLEMGVCPEQARMVLPQSMYTEWIWSGSVAAFARVCNLRIDPHTQMETQNIAIQISTALENKFPHSWKALTRNG